MLDTDPRLNSLIHHVEIESLSPEKHLKIVEYLANNPENPCQFIPASKPPIPFKDANEFAQAVSLETNTPLEHDTMSLYESLIEYVHMPQIIDSFSLINDRKTSNDYRREWKKKIGNSNINGIPGREIIAVFQHNQIRSVHISTIPATLQALIMFNGNKDEILMKKMIDIEQKAWDILGIKSNVATDNSDAHYNLSSNEEKINAANEMTKVVVDFMNIFQSSPEPTEKAI